MCCPQQPDIESARGQGKEDGSEGREFIVVEFNAWECAGAEVLWAAVITKIFDQVFTGELDVFKQYLPCCSS